MNDHSEATVELPRTTYLDHTLRRARSAAEQRSHRYVTLEHLLFTLLDDPDASRLLTVIGADVALIRAAVTDTVNNRMSSLAVPDGRPPNFSYKFDTLFIAASQDAARAGRHEIDGALALLAIAREPESNASAILAANGFNPSAALHAIASSRTPHRPQETAPPPVPSQPLTHREANKPTSVAPPPQKTSAPAADDAQDGMDDMLASVRDILEAEQRKEAASSAPPAFPALSAPPPPAPATAVPKPPSLGPALPAQTPPPLPQSGYAPDEDAPRLEPGFGLSGDGYPALPPQPVPQLRTEPPQQPLPNETARPNETAWSFPAPEISRAAEIPGGVGGPEGPRLGLERRPAERVDFANPVPPSFALEPPAPPLPFDAPPSPRFSPVATEPARPPVEAKGDKKGKRRTRNADQATGLLARILQPIPRITRIAVPETVELLLSREEAWALFARARPQGAASVEAYPHAPVRAITVRLTAPEGGFFIEGQSPETQWLLDRPAFMGEEPFGSWVWLVVPNDKGPFSLVVTLHARDIDANGAASDLHLPDQVVKVQVRGNFWRGFLSFLRTLILLSAGGGLGAAAYYGLKMMGKVP